MNLAYTPFLFLFLPMATGLYFLIPAKNGLRFRNLFLLLISIFFYAWGEPVNVFLLMLLILVVWLLGKMAEGNKGTTVGKLAVALTVIVSVGALLPFKYFAASFPIGLSFFCFHAISYVVDIYRGQCHSAKRITDAALYLSVFFKMLQGPIVTYREFEPQIENRSSSWENVSEGLWRFTIGLGKKMIIATNLQPIVDIFLQGHASYLTMADAWIACVVFLVFLYFDFSGYSDMAIGLGRVFGFKIPENFNYPYVSTSIGEYWRRWHITLIAWFRDYLYYPVLLGPSVRFRKFLLKHNVSTNSARTMQNLFVPACVWIVTALWHGTNWNYTIWGLVNWAAIIIEPHLRPLKFRQLDKALRWCAVMLLLMLMVPLIGTKDLDAASHYFAAMFSGTGLFAISPLIKSLLNGSGAFLLIGIIGCFPIVPQLKGRFWEIIKFALLVIILFLSLAYIFKGGTIWFMYQK